MADKGYLERLTRELADKGKLIEAGCLRIVAIHPDASPAQLDEMRMAFFAGAQHLFGSMMSMQGMFDEGDEPTENDERRMQFISEELKEFLAEFKLRVATPKGSS